MAERVKTEAERRLYDSAEALGAAAVRSEPGEGSVIRAYRFADGSTLQVRRLSGRCAFSASGWHLANSK
ncbi:TPA: hypothetical protein P8734_005706 [Pseudomonas aeruginosa]|nr:hypothetical protein [Pseudomonas aeruginosa]